MSMQIENGFELLAEYAERVRENPELAEEIRTKSREIEFFLIEKHLSNIPPNELSALIDDLRSEEDARKQSHLALLAGVALAVDSGEFVHSSAQSVAAEVRSMADDGEDRIITVYTPKTLAGQIRSAGKMLRIASGNVLRVNYPDISFQEQSDLTIGSFTQEIGTHTFLQEFRSSLWSRTIQNFAMTLPERTTISTVSTLLEDFSKYSRIKSIDERVAAIQEA